MQQGDPSKVDLEKLKRHMLTCAECGAFMDDIQGMVIQVQKETIVEKVVEKEVSIIDPEVLRRAPAPRDWTWEDIRKLRHRRPHMATIDFIRLLGISTRTYYRWIDGAKLNARSRTRLCELERLFDEDDQRLARGEVEELAIPKPFEVAIKTVPKETRKRGRDAGVFRRSYS